jgi:hypothetical protein
VPASACHVLLGRTWTALQAIATLHAIVKQRATLASICLVQVQHKRVDAFSASRILSSRTQRGTAKQNAQLALTKCALLGTTAAALVQQLAMVTNATLAPLAAGSTNGGLERALERPTTSATPAPR